MEKNENNLSSQKWKPFLRQFLICSTSWVFAIMYGMSLGTPTVMIPQLRKENNSNDSVSDDMASWISSVVSFGGILWVLVLTALSHFLGHKKTVFILAVTTFMGFVNLYYSRNTVQILVSQALLGNTAAAVKTTSMMIVMEYTSPKYRGVFSTLKAASVYWGIWLANAMGTFFHWKSIALCGITCSVYNFLVNIITPESPYWLADNRCYDECSKAHRWLKGAGDEAEQELNIIIKRYKEKEDRRYMKPKRSLSYRVHKYFKTLLEPEIWKPILCCFLVSTIYDMSGKLSCTVYSIQIIKKITGSEHTAYIGMLILDGITIVGMYIGCGLSKLLRRRTLLLAAGSIGNTLLYIMSCYLILVKFSVISENKYVSISLLIVYSIAVCCGPIILSITVYSELIPMKSRSLCVVIVAMFTKLSVGVFLKIAPSLFKFLGFHGTFLFYGVGSSLLLFLFYKYLPETKDKTLFEIADYFKKKKTIEQNSLMCE